MGNHLADGSGPAILLETPATARLLGNYAATDGSQLLQVRGAVRDALASGNLFVCSGVDVRTAFAADGATNEPLVLASNTIVADKGSRREFHPALRASSNNVLDAGS